MAMKPSFVLGDAKERETYLSQTGNFTPAERSLFHKLCEAWEPVIPLKSFFKYASKDIPNCDSELTKLISKLKSLRMGLIVTDIIRGERSPRGIVICEPNDKFFYAYVLNEEILNVSENLNLPLPTKQNLLERNIVIPENIIDKTSYQDTANIHVSGRLNSTNILAIQLDIRNSLIVPQMSVSRLVSIHIAKMQANFKIELLFDLAAQIMQKRLNELRGSLSSEEPVFWLNVSKAFNEHRRKVEGQQKVKLPPDLFFVTYFIENFLMAQMASTRQHREIEQERKDDMKFIAEVVRNHSEYLITREYLDNQIETMREKYPDSFEAFRDGFDKTILQNENKKTLPIILKVHDNYIHGENVRNFFLRRVEHLSQELLLYYLPRMTQYMAKTRNSHINTFNSSEAFEADIQQKVSDLEPYVAELLQRPALVAEAFIQSAKKSGRIKNVDDMKAVLITFFYPEQIQFKELQVIFSLNISDLYRRAFLNCGIFRQFFLKITGKHESYNRKFSEQSRKIYQRMANEAALPRNLMKDASRGKDSNKSKDADKKSGSRLQPGNIRDLPSRDTPKTARSKGPRRVKASPQYSRKEQDKAWTEFSKRIKE